MSAEALGANIDNLQRTTTVKNPSLDSNWMGKNKNMLIGVSILVVVGVSAFFIYKKFKK